MKLLIADDDRQAARKAVLEKKLSTSERHEAIMKMGKVMSGKLTTHARTHVINGPSLLMKVENDHKVALEASAKRKLDKAYFNDVQKAEKPWFT